MLGEIAKHFELAEREFIFSVIEHVKICFSMYTLVDLLSPVEVEIEGDTVEEKVTNLTADLFEVSKERDMLLEQVELLKEEQSISASLPKNLSSQSQSGNEELVKSNQVLQKENESIKKELDILTKAINEDEAESFEKQDRVVSELLKQIKELREENIKLKKELERKEVDHKASNIVNATLSKQPLSFVDDKKSFFKKTGTQTLQNVTSPENNEFKMYICKCASCCTRNKNCFSTRIFPVGSGRQCFRDE